MKELPNFRNSRIKERIIREAQTQTLRRWKNQFIETENNSENASCDYSLGSMLSRQVVIKDKSSSNNQFSSNLRPWKLVLTWSWRDKLHDERLCNLLEEDKVITRLEFIIANLLSVGSLVRHQTCLNEDASSRRNLKIQQATFIKLKSFKQTNEKLVFLSRVS